MPYILSWAKALLVKPETLGLCFNTLMAYHNNFRQNREKITQQYHMHISPKQLTCPGLFIAFSKST